MENRIANTFIVCVIDEDGSIVAELGDEFTSLQAAINSAESITVAECQETGAFCDGGNVGVNVQIWACDHRSSIATDRIAGSMCIYDRFV